MNRKLFRTIFNAARGMRMVVAETTASTGKGSNKATTAAGTPVFAPPLLAAALAGMLAMPAAHAQIIANPMAPGGMRPTILVAPNGIPVINLTTPSAAGVSRNQYIQFDVSGRGVVVNNSRGNVQSTIGGWINGNPYLATGPARVIVNEVNSSNPSYINGPVEIAGQRAEFILANPSGISVSGGAFINAAGVTLTTGTPQYNAFGGLDSYVVRGGTVTINGTGLDVSKTDYAAILARAVQINAAIYATDLKVVTGANTVSADRSQITPTTGTGATPTFALDVSQLGGMFANHIFLVGTEAGLGVRNAGSIGASNGNLIVTSAGRLENTGTLEGTRVELASAGDIDNRGGTIRQTSSVGLTITAPTLSNTNGGVIGIEPVPAAGTGGGTGGGAETGTGGGTGTGGTTTSPSTPTSGTGSGSSGSTAAPAPAPFVPASPGSITAAGSILNDGGRIYAGGPITLNTPQINNAGGTLSVATMAVTGPNFSNAGGTLNVSNSFSANVGQLDNTGGKLNAGSLNIATNGDLINTDGTLTSVTDANLSVGGKVENTRGTISAAGALTANVAGATINNSGTLASNQALTLKSDSLQNTQGSIQSAQAGVQLGVTNALTNGNGGSINAATDLGVQAGSFANGGSLRGGNDATIAVGSALTNDGSLTAGRNTTLTAGSVQSNNSGVLGAGIQSDGKLGSVGDLRVTASGALVANGTNLAAGNATLQGQSVDLSASQTSAANIAITATQGNVTTSKATVVTPGTLAVTANSNAAQTLVNDAGQLNAGQLQIKVSNLANTNGGEIVQTGTGATTIATSGTLNNDGGRIASNGQDLTLQGASITNASGKIEHAGTGTLTLAGGSFSGTEGQITANNALVVAMSGVFNQDGSKATTSAKRITIDAGSLSNRGGQIVQTGSDATRITVVGAVANTAGTIASNGNTNVAAGSLTNQGGTIRAAETSGLDLTVGGLLDNSKKGVIGAGGNTTITADSFNNDTGNATAVGDLNATIAGAATNAGGTLAANGNTTVTAASLNNSKQGTIAAVNGELSIATTSTTTNDGGTLQAGAKTTLSNNGLSNVGGKVFGNSLSVNTRANGQNNALDNSEGTLAATTTVDVQSGALTNDAGLIQSGSTMTINTNGQSLSNKNAAGYSNQQGGITSADTLDLKTGTVNNKAGFIGSRNALTASTQAFDNTSKGTVLAQSSVTINTNGAGYDNSGGQTQAVGDLGISAGSITNVGGLIRSTTTTSLNAGSISNTSTQGTNQGIEGQNVVVGTSSLDNTSGAIRADVNATIASGSTLTNTNGLISAGNTLAIVDPNRSNPAAKTLSVVNTGGTLVAGTAAVPGTGGKVQTAAFGKLEIDAKGFSGDGTTVGVNDLSIALTQDVTNSVDVKAGGNLTYATTGKLINNGKLLAGGTVTASGNEVENTVNAEITGDTTIVSGTNKLTNRGLIDGRDTQINGGTVNNLGTGRIYGDVISVAVGTLNNDSETFNGVTKAGTIASRGDLNIGAQSILNRDHALIFSVGDMFIGGNLDANRQATTVRGGTLNNLSANIESLGDMSIAMEQTNNFDNHFAVVRTSSGPVNGKSTITPLGGVELPADHFVLDRGGRVWSTIINGQVVSGQGWIERQYTTTTEVDQPANPPDPGRIYAGGKMSIDGKLHNRDSQVMAGPQSTFDPANIDNTPTQGQRIVTEGGLQVYVPPEKGNNLVPSLIPEQKSVYTIDVGANCFNDCNGMTPSGKKPGAAQGVAVGNQTGAAGEVTAGTRARAIVEVPSAVGGVVKTDGSTADGAGAIGGASGTGGANSIALVVRTSLPNTTIPTTSLFGIHAGPGGYLIETDPRFANYRTWLSSDYLLNSLGQDPNNTLKRLGDGFYEQKLIREQVAQLTGYRFLDGYSSDEEQYAGLMNSGVTFAKEYGLRPGIALTPVQMAQLTSDIVWLVEQTVTLPDGTTQQVLVPQVYVRVQPGDITGSGSVLSADRMIIKGKGDLTNSGTIAGRTLVDINANNINNLGGRIAGGSVLLDAKNDINNIGGSITGANSVSLKAGRDIKIETTINTQAGLLANKANIDRVAGVYVTNPGGTLVASAGNDVNVIGGILSNKGPGSFTSVTAGKNINLGTVTESSTRLVIFNANTYYGDASSKETGSTITGNGTVSLNAKGGDINARAATVDAGNGLLSLAAAGDINITSGVDAKATMGAGQSTNKSFLRSTTTTFTGTSQSSTSIGSSFTGGIVVMDAGNNLNIEGAHIAGQDGVALHGGNSVNIYEARNTASVGAGFDKKTSGLNFNPTLGAVIGPRGNGSTLEIKTDVAAPTTISGGNGGVLIEGGVVNMRGVQVDAAKDIKIEGGNVNIAAAENRLEITATETSRGGSFNALGIHSFGKGINAKNADKMESSATSLTNTTLNSANVSIAAIGAPGSAGGTLNLAGTTVNTPGTLTLKGDQVNLLPQTTETSVRNTSQGGDVAWQKTTDKGSTDQKLNYNQLNFGQLAVDANHVQVGLNAKDSVEALSKQPGMGWINQLQNDPKLSGKIDWAKVDEAHRNWDYRQQGLTPEAAAVVTLVVAYFTAGAASGVGESVGGSLGAANTVALADGTLFAGAGLSTSGAVISGAVTAGITTLASQAAVSLINNQGDIGRTLHDLGSSAGVKNLLTAIVTGGVLSGLNLNPTGLPTTSGGSQSFFAQLGQNLQAGAARALIGTAINGGSFEENLKNGLKNAILDTIAAQAANEIGDLTKKEVLNDFTNKVAHAIAGCMVGAVRADSASGCGAGALGAAIGEFAAEAYGRQTDTVQFAAMVAGIAVAITGGDASLINLGSQAGGNAAANNFLNHDQWMDYARERAACTTQKCVSDTDKKYSQISAGMDEKLATCDSRGDCDTLIKQLNEGTSTRDALIRRGDLAEFFAGAGNLQWQGQQLAVNPTMRADVSKALDNAKFCNANPGTCATRTVTAAAAVLAPLYGAAVADAAITLLVSAGRMTVAEATLVVQLGGLGNYCGVKPDTCLVIVETAAGLASNSVAPTVVPIAGAKVVNTMQEAVAGEKAVATAGGFVNPTKICDVGCVIGGLTVEEQALATRIRAGADSNGGELTEQLLEMVSRRTGMSVLTGGKYGSNNGFDLVLQDARGNVTIIVDGKQFSQSGAFSVDTNAAGGAIQMSPDWVRNVLLKLPPNSPARQAITRAIEGNTLTMAVGGVNRTTGELIVVPITVANKRASPVVVAPGGASQIPSN